LDASFAGKVALLPFCNSLGTKGFIPDKACQRGYNHAVKRSCRLNAVFVRALFREMEPLHLELETAEVLMSLTIVTVIFGIFAAGLIILLIYKSTLTMHEDEQLFLDDHNSHMQEEQTELLTKVNRLTVPVWVFSIGSGVFLLLLVAMLIYQKLNEVQ
jgi:hypothetical protein